MAVRLYQGRVVIPRRAAQDAATRDAITTQCLTDTQDLVKADGAVQVNLNITAWWERWDSAAAEYVGCMQGGLDWEQFVYVVQIRAELPEKS